MNAYGELASEISITIQSETTVTATEDTKGKHYESVEVQIKSLVSQNLEQVEPVDAWYSKRDGYWYYCNLSKEKWDHIQNREKYGLRDRVLVMVEPVLKSPSESIADKIKILSKGIDMVENSGFAGQIEVDLMGEKGFLFDLMKRKREQLLSSLSVEVLPEKITVSPSIKPGIDIHVVSEEQGQAGVIHLLIRQKNKELVEKVVTGKDGIYSGDINFMVLSMSKSRVEAQISLEDLGFNKEDTALVSVPSREFIVDVRPIETFLVVTVKGDIAIVGITDSVAFLVNYFDPAVEMYRKSSFPSNHRLHNYLLFHNNTEPYYPPYFILRELLLRCVFTPARKAVRAYH